MTQSGEEVLAAALAASKARRAKKAVPAAAGAKKRGRPAKEKVDPAAVDIANEEAAAAVAARSADDSDDAPTTTYKKATEKSNAERLAERQGPCGAVPECPCNGWSPGRTFGYWVACAGCGHTQHVHAVGPARTEAEIEAANEAQAKLLLQAELPAPVEAAVAEENENVEEPVEVA